jgi:hypothetical protein
MRIFHVLLILFFVACQTPSEQEKLHKTLTGEWIVLLADHQLKNEDQRQIYGRMQDSVIGDKALKLVTFFDNGGFQQIDSPEQKGKWAVSPALRLFIAKGGRGFDDFKVEFSEYKKKVLHVVEYLQAGKESIKLIWYLKKINKPALFSGENNSWRKKASKPESETEIKQRLSAMLAFYSDYFDLVAEESSFFISSRVVLPLKFYQHAMGTLPFDEKSDFAKLFYNIEQSKQAHTYLKKKVYDLGDRYPGKKNFVAEYASFMGIVAKEIRNEK